MRLDPRSRVAGQSQVRAPLRQHGAADDALEGRIQLDGGCLDLPGAPHGEVVQRSLPSRRGLLRSAELAALGRRHGEGECADPADLDEGQMREWGLGMCGVVANLPTSPSGDWWAARTWMQARMRCLCPMAVCVAAVQCSLCSGARVKVE